jgi:hypothetical protein
MKNGNHKTEGNGHANGNGKAAAAIHGAAVEHATAPFFAMTRRETATLYQALLRATFPDAEVRALVRRMGKSLEGER